MKKDLKSNILKTTTAAIFSQICSMLTALLLPRLIIATLGSEYNGLISTARQFVTYLALVDTGLYSATCYRFIKAFEENDTNQIQDLFATVGSFYRKVSFVATALVVMVALGYVALVSSSVPSYLSFYILIAYCFSTLVAYYTFFKYNIVLFASGKQYYITWVCALSTVAILIGQYVLLRLGASVVLVVTVHPIVVVLRLLLLKRKTLRDHGYLSEKKGNIQPALIDQKWDALVMNISDAMKTFAPIVIISLLWGAAKVSVYCVYETVLHLGSSILVMCFNGLTPSLGRELNKISQKSCDQLRRINTIIMAASGIICACFASMIMSFIAVYIGDEADISYNYPHLAYVLIFSVWFLMTRLGFEMVIKAQGYIKELRDGAVHEIIIAMIACLGSSLLFGFEYIAVGVALASAYRTLRMIRFCARDIYSSYKTYFWKDFLLWSIFTFVMCCVGIRCIPVSSNWAGFIGWSLVVGLSCVLIFTLTYFGATKAEAKCAK